MQFAKPLPPQELRPSRRYDVTTELAKLRPARPTGRRDKVLIITTGHDDHADDVAIELVGAGTPVSRLNVEDFPTRSCLTIETDGGSAWARGTLELPSGTLALDEVKSVWFRRRLPELFGLGPPPDDVAAFVERESQAAFLGLYGVLGDAFWVSSPAALFAADSKLGQLDVAAGLGLTIPRTLVTNDPERARTFVASCRDGAIVKAFRGQVGPTFETTQLIYTTRVGAAELETIELVRDAPCLFQETVDRDADVRVTVIGRDLFAVDIKTREDPSSVDVDCRAHDPRTTDYVPVALPPVVAEACMKLVDHWGLGFAAIDLIRRPDGTYVFLELNTKGDWTWIEYRTSLPMTQTMAALLRRASLAPEPVTGSSADRG